MREELQILLRAEEIRYCPEAQKTQKHVEKWATKLPSGKYIWTNWQTTGTVSGKDEHVLQRNMIEQAPQEKIKALPEEKKKS